MKNLYLTKALDPKLLKLDASKPTRAMLKFMPASELEMKALGEDIPPGYVAGWASTPDVDSYRHIVEKGAFDESIARKGLTGPKSVKLLIGHEWDKVAGVIKVLETRGDRLWIEAQMNLGISYVKDSYEAAKMLGGLNFSVGFGLEDYSFRKHSDGEDVLVISKGDLAEVSIVPFPGNEEATMEFIKSAEQPAPASLAEFEKSLVSSGLAKSRNDAQRITQEVKKSLDLFVKAGDPPVEKPPAPAQPVLAKAKLDELSALVAKMKQTVAGTA